MKMKNVSFLVLCLMGMAVACSAGLFGPPKPYSDWQASFPAFSFEVKVADDVKGFAADFSFGCMVARSGLMSGFGGYSERTKYKKVPLVVTPITGKPGSFKVTLKEKVTITDFKAKWKKIDKAGKTEYALDDTITIHAGVVFTFQDRPVAKKTIKYDFRARDTSDLWNLGKDLPKLLDGLSFSATDKEVKARKIFNSKLDEFVPCRVELSAR
jgi:hypothetical protein